MGVRNSAPPAGDGAFARWLAARAGAELLRVREQAGFDDPAALKLAGDKLSHELIRAELDRWRPADAVLSEEDDQARRAYVPGPRPPATGEQVEGEPPRLRADRVWIIDPLDGTREFSESGRTDWAVHVALWSRSAGGLVAGAVALPARHQTLGTDAPPSYPPLAAQAGAAAPVRLAVSRSRPPAFVTAFAADLGAELVPMGSAGVKIAAVITGEVDAYVHHGGQYEWDSAAPVAVATATGLYASRIDGSTLEYNQGDPKLPDLLVCRRDLATRLLAALRRHL